MVDRSGRIAGLVLVGVLISPGLAQASLWDFIWKMSGPQMTTVFIVHCEWGFGDIASEETKKLRSEGKQGLAETRSECRFADKRFIGNAKSRDERKMWL